jgi:Domain of unknown function (DUF4062)
VMFEQGARPHPPRDLYRAYLSQSDIFVGLYWQSYGRVSPGMQVSGLEEEFELAQDLPRLLYAKVPAPDREPRLEELIARIRRETSYRKFETADELEGLVREDLATLLSERFAASRASAGPGPARRRPRSLPARMNRSSDASSSCRRTGERERKRLLDGSMPNSSRGPDPAIAVGQKDGPACVLGKIVAARVPEPAVKDASPGEASTSTAPAGGSKGGDR